MTLEQLRLFGFDDSTKSGRHLRVACSQCEALVINGVPTHETGCPHAMHECAGCNEVIPLRQRYCATCG
jgi:hypothetical protein